MEPAFHDLYSKTDIKIDVSPKEPQNNCVSFTRSKPEPREPWKKGQIFDKTIRIFKSYIGPSGAKKGYQAITGYNFITNCFSLNLFNVLCRSFLNRVSLVYQRNASSGNMVTKGSVLCV